MLYVLLYMSIMCHKTYMLINHLPVPQNEQKSFSQAWHFENFLLLDFRYIQQSINPNRQIENGMLF